MGAALNDGLRFLIGVFLRGAGCFAAILHRMRARSYARCRARLRKRLGIRPETQLSTSLPETCSPGESDRLAHTSGTGGEPKRIAYSRRRLARVRWVFIESFSRVFWGLGVRRTSLYVFGPLEGEASLTGLLLSENRLPGYLATLQAPYRIHASSCATSIGRDLRCRRSAAVDSGPLESRGAVQHEPVYHVDLSRRARFRLGEVQSLGPGLRPESRAGKRC